MNHELPHVQAGFRKGRGTTDQIANICWIIKKAREFQKKHLLLLYLLCQSLWLWITTNCGEFFKRWEYQITLSASWEICMQVRRQQLEHGHGMTNWFQIRKGVCQGCVLSPCLFNLYAECIMRNAGLDEALAGIKIAGRNINNLRHEWATSLSLFTFRHWRRTWQPTPVFLPGESQGRGSLVGCCLWCCTESDMTEAT